ncbi:MAG TPA: cyclase family protein [Candidatus Acidoferrales bacterium]|jgi:kynurenine formamidase|nr:cyclase family protein [Candidatus Acidoferrales bacterium]
MPPKSDKLQKNSLRESLEAVAPGRGRIIDLTHAINADSPPWPGDTKSFEAIPNASVEKDGYFTRSFWMLEHYGTHLDAPIHFPPGKTTVDRIPPERLIGPAVVLDVRSDGERDADYRLPVARIQKWERAHGAIPAGSIVLLRTGRTSLWADANRYRGMDSAGTMHFPGFSVEAVEYLISKRVSGIGADAMSVDPGNSRGYEVHHLALGSDLFQIENLADLSALPEAGAWLVVAPIKLEGGSGGPCRVFALLPE